jgi:hypothetical protein
MSNLILISASATITLIVVTMAVANPGNGIGWETSVSDNTIGMNKTLLAPALASVVGRDLLVLLVIVCYYRRRGGASATPCVFASGRGRGLCHTPKFQILECDYIH